jgi:hypothetical protein
MTMKRWFLMVTVLALLVVVGCGHDHYHHWHHWH